MLLAQMHLALMFFAAKVSKPVVVVWEQRSLRDLIDREVQSELTQSTKKRRKCGRWLRRKRKEGIFSGDFQQLRRK